ncbi:hypothetical protein [Caulobacter mirabilis]|uniref:Uncharacterized protein n=1 Tax=Caulobacter mirabilis TaxID=69666 RepID=A0A2D2AX85_9CAUL|nr:hypothetical protein [Caulobacter mirabilis]ATQ42628.1 hypothetical protein CSW64_09515 [Caulobacter mirabilis]
MADQSSVEWEDRILQGEFEAIPHNLPFRTAFRLAYLIDGYETAGGFEALADIANTTRTVAAANQLWVGDARTLWLTLFFEQRRVRHPGQRPEAAELALLDRLTEALRTALVAIPADERSVFLSSFKLTS